MSIRSTPSSMRFLPGLLASLVLTQVLQSASPVPVDLVDVEGRKILAQIVWRDEASALVKIEDRSPATIKMERLSKISQAVVESKPAGWQPGFGGPPVEEKTQTPRFDPSKDKNNSVLVASANLDVALDIKSARPLGQSAHLPQVLGGSAKLEILPAAAAEFSKPPQFFAIRCAVSYKHELDSATDRAGNFLVYDTSWFRVGQTKSVQGVHVAGWIDSRMKHGQKGHIVLSQETKKGFEGTNGELDLTLIVLADSDASEFYVRFLTCLAKVEVETQAAIAP